MLLTGLVAVRLLDTSGRGGGLAGGLGSKLLTGGLATSGLTYWKRLVQCIDMDRANASPVVLRQDT